MLRGRSASVDYRRATAPTELKEAVMTDVSQPLYFECEPCSGTGKAPRRREGFQRDFPSDSTAATCGQCRGWGITVGAETRPLFDLIATMIERHASR
jgi:DnaJ-class molecular chaperone